MELGGLDDRELDVMVGLVKLVVHADREISPAERDVLGRLQAAIGSPRWNAAVLRARDAFPTIEALEVAARQVTRPEVRNAVHRVLVELAGSDQVIEAEAHVLRWVVTEWHLGEPDDAEEDDGPPSGESFALIEE